MTDKYAVIGNPISHSKSPQIHAAFAKQTNQDITYEAVLAPLDGFEKTVKDLIAKGYKGANVTVPFKQEAYKLYSTYAPQVQLAHAINTLIFADTRIVTHNTDGEGLINDITKNLGKTISNKKVLLLGAGGAAEAVYHFLEIENPSNFVLANRTFEKAEKLTTKFLQSEAKASTFQNLENQRFDIIINATSTGLTDTALPIPNSIFAKDCLAYDMVYGRETPFMAQARAAGAQVSDGLGMLVEQAAKAFYLWRGVRPETAPVITLLRQS